MKRLSLLLLLIPILLLSGCKGRGIKDISVTSVRLVSITPEGFSGVSALIEVGIHNPTIGFEVTNVTGVAKFQGQEALAVHADQLMVPAHSDALYRIPMQGNIADGFNPLRLLRLLGKSAGYEDVVISSFSVSGLLSMLLSGISSISIFLPIPPRAAIRAKTLQVTSS